MPNYQNEQEYLEQIVLGLSLGYSTLRLLDPAKHTSILGIPCVATTVYLRNHRTLVKAKFLEECRKAGYSLGSLSGEDVTFFVPLAKVLETCAEKGKAPKFDKVVGSTGDLEWKTRQPNRMTDEERAYIVAHPEEYNLNLTHGNYSSITPKAVPVGLRSKDSGKAARSALIASFNKNMYPWLILMLNLTPPNGRTWIGGVYKRVDGFDNDDELCTLRTVAVRSMRQTRAAIKEYQQFEFMCRKISAFFKHHKDKTNLEIKEIIVTKCLEKIFSNTPKYMDISPFNVVAKALSK